MPKRKRPKIQRWGTDFTGLSGIFWLFWAVLVYQGNTIPLRARMRWYVRVRVGHVCTFLSRDNTIHPIQKRKCNPGIVKIMLTQYHYATRVPVFTGVMSNYVEIWRQMTRILKFVMALDRMNTGLHVNPCRNARLNPIYCYIRFLIYIFFFLNLFRIVKIDIST